jgi:hypothetical protein
VANTSSPTREALTRLIHLLHPTDARGVMAWHPPDATIGSLVRVERLVAAAGGHRVMEILRPNPIRVSPDLGHPYELPTKRGTWKVTFHHKHPGSSLPPAYDGVDESGKEVSYFYNNGSPLLVIW